MVETHKDPQNGAIPQHPERLQGGSVSTGGVIPHKITLMSPLSCMAGMYQMTKRLSCLDQWLKSTSNTFDESQPKYTW